MKRIKNFKLGFELEIGIEEEDYLNIEEKFGISDYHSGIYHNNLFRFEKDGSLESFSWKRCLEIISYKLYSKEEVRNSFKWLKNNAIEFYNDIEINYTMGLHINFSFYKWKHFINPTFFALCRFHFFNSINKSDLDNYIKTKIKFKYFRGYAEKSNFKRFSSLKNNKYQEFHVHGNRVEWRSINACGSTSLNEVEKVVLIAWDSIHKAYFDFLKRGFSQKFKFILNENKIKPKKEKVVICVE